MPIKTNTTDLQALLEAANDLPVAENLDTELSTQDTLIANIMTALDGKTAGVSKSENNLVARTLTTYSNDQVDKVGAYVFTNLNELTEVDLPAVTDIGTYAFNYCKNLARVNMPMVKNIDGSAFYYCSALNTVNFPLLETFGGSSVFNRSGLTEACFPKLTVVTSGSLSNITGLVKADFSSLSDIKDTAFYNDSSLKAVILRSESMCALSYSNAFSNTPIASGAGYIYVPSALLTNYQSATNWSTYSTQFRALENYTVDGTITGALDESKI